MDFSVGEAYFGKNGTSYAGIKATITYVTSRYVEVGFEPPLRISGMILHGTILGKRQFLDNFGTSHQMTIYDFLNEG